ncbi:MAG: zinc ribbon domain-containing protein [Bacteroidaceae bacterium]|nr:zinc ribbon domain-containing protein [Bacteroidaceae bacterium]
MSLITCPECKNEVSSRASNCPHCGVQIAGNVKRCPVCGTLVFMDATQCPECQTRFQVVSSDSEKEESQTSAPCPPIVADPRPLLDNADSQTSDTPPSDGNPPVVQKPRSSVPWWLLCLGILVVAIGGFLYWENQNQEEAEEHAFELLEHCNNPLNFEDFIARFPGSAHIEEVRARLRELEQENETWLKSSGKMSAQELQAFVDAHPGSPYKKLALQKIDTLDWKEADRRGTSAAYDAYITKHDNGDFLDKAFAAREAARNREERARRDSLAASDTVVATPVQ